MRIDSHQHFWRYAANKADYGWMDDAHAALRRDFLPEDLAPLLAAAGFDGTVAVQAREVPAETDFLLDLADHEDWIMGVVGWLDLCDPAIEPAIERAASRPKLRGLRMLIHDRPDPGFAIADPHRRGVGLLRRYGLTYDLLLRPEHIPAACALADAWPEQPFVVDHLAKPRIGTPLSPWRERLAELAGRANVCCKLSGLVTEATWHGWQPADFTPYLDAALDMFGPGRLMIGSDWPVCTLSGSYAATMAVVTGWAARLSPDEQDAILGANCARFYGLPAR